MIAFSTTSRWRLSRAKHRIPPSSATEEPSARKKHEKTVSPTFRVSRFLPAERLETFAVPARIQRTFAGSVSHTGRYRTAAALCEDPQRRLFPERFSAVF